LETINTSTLDAIYGSATNANTNIGDASNDDNLMQSNENDEQELEASTNNINNNANDASVIGNRTHANNVNITDTIEHVSHSDEDEDVDEQDIDHELARDEATSSLTNNNGKLKNKLIYFC
jgi:hypothetical protein